jgi:hypothetical protein
MKEMTQEAIEAGAIQQRINDSESVAQILVKSRNDIELVKILQNKQNKVLRGAADFHKYYFANTSGGTTAETEVTLFTTESADETFIITQIGFLMLGEIGEAGVPLDIDAKVVQNAVIEITAGKQVRSFPVNSCFNVAAPVNDGSDGLEATNGEYRLLEGSFKMPLATIAQGDKVTIKVKSQTALAVTAAKGGAALLRGYKHTSV